MFAKATIIVAVAAVLAAAGSMFADDNKPDNPNTDNKKSTNIAIKGKVIDDKGKPADAEIHVKAVDRKSPEVVVLTDSRGHYIVTDLNIGRYSVTAFDDYGFARSRAIIDVPRKGWAKVDFDLSLDKGQGDGPDRLWQGALHGHLTNPSSHGAPISAIQ
jgi:Carboxypeptidase regulatory-like domain